MLPAARWPRPHQAAGGFGLGAAPVERSADRSADAKGADEPRREHRGY